MNSLQETIIEIYTRNIKYFQMNNKKLYNKIRDFEISNQENYYIDISDGIIDIIESKTNSKLYNCDPFYDAQYRAQNISKNNLNFELISLNETHLDYGGIDEEITAKNMVEQYCELYNEDNLYCSHKKFIFFGTLLGIHINEIHKYINAKSYLIIEPNIEIFRLSLFFTDYVEISQNSEIEFCINENKEIICDKIDRFIDKNYQYNHFIGFELSDEKQLYLFSLVSDFIALKNESRYPFTEYLYSLERGIFYLRNDFKFLNFNQSNSFSIDKKILFIGAGPSLEKQIDFIIDHQNEFIIVCAAATLKILEYYKIIPQIIISVDGGKSTVLNQLDVDEVYYNNAIILASTKTDINIINNLNKENIYFFQLSVEILDHFGLFNGVTVGDVGLKVLLSLGIFREIYLLGVDAAIDLERGMTHSSKYEYNSIIDPKEKMVEVEGNIIKTVHTTLLYKDMIESINDIHKDLFKDIKIYNLSTCGAKFENIVPIRCEDIFDEMLGSEIIDKVKIIQEIQKELNSIIQRGLSVKNTHWIKTEHTILSKLKLEKNSIKNFESFFKKYNASIGLNILHKFLRLTSPYIDHLNSNKAYQLQKKQFNSLIDKLLSIFY